MGSSWSFGTWIYNYLCHQCLTPPKLCVQISLMTRCRGEGGGLKKVAPSGERREQFGGISCEKSRFYANKSYFFPILAGARAPGSAHVLERDHPPTCTNIFHYECNVKRGITLSIILYNVLC